MRISDGKGNNRDMEVDQFYRAVVQARSDFAHAARLGLAFSWASAAKDIDVDDTVILVANIVTTHLLYIHSINVSVDVDAAVIVHSPTYPTLAGDAITGVNLNRNLASKYDPAAYSIAYGDETGNSAGSTLWSGWVGAYGDNMGGNEIHIPAGAIILGYHDCIAVDIKTEPTSALATIIGYMEEIE